GNDIILGGAAGDVIDADIGNNVVFGDNGFVDYVVADGNASDIDKIGSLDETTGGADHITTGDGNDIVIGGFAGDEISAGRGDNVVFGDSGVILAAADNTDARRFGNLAPTAITLGSLTTTPTAGAGNDAITTLEGSDVILAGT